MKFSQYILVSLLFFGALFLVGFFTIISDKGPFATEGKNLVIFFDNADGIKVGSSVNIIGVPGGDVRSVDLIAVDKDKKIVSLSSPKRVGQRVAISIELLKEVVFYSNYKIDIKNSSLLGGKTVSIDPGTAVSDEGGNELRENKVLKILYLSKLGFSSSILENYIRVSEKGDVGYVHLEGATSGDPISSLSELVSENRQNVRETIQNIRDITNKIARGEGTIGKLVNDDELHRNAVTLLSDAQIVLREARETIEDTREQAPVDSFVRALLTAF